MTSEINSTVLSKEIYERMDQIEGDLVFLMNEFRALKRKIQIAELPEGTYTSFEELYKEIEKNGIK